MLKTVPIWKKGGPVVTGCAGCAMAHPDFGRLVNPISTRGDRLCPSSYYWHTQIFRPSDDPVICVSNISPPRLTKSKIMF